MSDDESLLDQIDSSLPTKAQIEEDIMVTEDFLAEKEARIMNRVKNVVDEELRDVYRDVWA